MRRRLGILAAAAAVLPAPAPAWAGPRFAGASGTVPSASGGYPWAFTTEYRRGRDPRRVLLGALGVGPGEPLGTGSTECTGAAVGGRFSLYAGRHNGIDVAAVGGALGEEHVRLVGLLADQKVARISLTPKDGVRHRLPTTLVPRGCGDACGRALALRVAWLADTGQEVAARAIGYSRRGRRVASWRP